MKLSHFFALSFGSLACIGGLAHAADAAAEKADPALLNTVQSCAACHGASGRSIAPTFPNLAAQTAPYIEAQLKAFKEQTRGDPDAQAYMWGMAAPLSDAMIGELAAYYAKQTPAKGTGRHRSSRPRSRRAPRAGVPPGLRPAPRPRP